MSTHQFQHKAFIETPLLGLLKEVVLDSDNVSNGIEFSSISGYILHSLFLRMTGAQEQKIKCVCWDLATVDYEYRYARFNKWELGECSKLKDKSAVFSDLVNAVRHFKPKYSVFGKDQNAKVLFLQKTLNSIKEILDNSNLSATYPREYSDFIAVFSNLNPNNIEAGAQLFKTSDSIDLASVKTENVLAATYSLLYKHRNRCAHNTLSYQVNIPAFHDLNNEFIQNHYNCFLFISILVLIDELFMRVYEKYQTALIEY